VAALSTTPPVFFPSAPRLRTLSRRDAVVVRAMAEAMFSEDGEASAARLDALVTDVDVHVSAASKPVRLGLRLALLVVRIAPVLFFVSLTSIERLPLAARVALLSRLERSPLSALSLAFIGWRTVMTLVFYEHPTELAALGYTSNERTRYKRGLPVLAPPVPAESGVRLVDESARGDADDSGAHAAHVAHADESGEHAAHDHAHDAHDAHDEVA